MNRSTCIKCLFFTPPHPPIPITCEYLHTLAHSNGTGGGDNRHIKHRER